MNYNNCFYRGRYVYSAKEFLEATRAGFFNLVYDHNKIKKMVNDIEKIIDFNKAVDLYAFCLLLFDERSKTSIDRCNNILDVIVSWDYIPAVYLLAQMYFYNLKGSDLKKFYNLSLRAANEGFVPAKNALALAYFNGYGCNADYAKGKKYLEECEKAYYGPGYFNLGIGYYKGLYGYPQSYEKALYYYKQGANQFHPKSMFNLALMYMGGIGCPKDVEKGLSELMTASGCGHVRAQITVADAYYFGEKVPKNIDRAYEHYLMAAENGDLYGMYSVGFMILKKEVYWVDKSVGLSWIRKAADAGYEDAIKLLKKL